MFAVLTRPSTMNSTVALKRTYVITKRSFHLSCIRLIDPKNVEEVRIPVPWGHIAGKWWGKKDVDPILAFHGWQDNAGSWDPLAMILPVEYSLLAIDFPGNGLSSHLPPLQNYYLADTVAVVRRIKRYFGLDKLNLLGHSGGSATCFLYSCTFPEDVKKYFGIDFLIYCRGDQNKRVTELGELIDKKIDLGLRDHNISKRYTWEEVLKIWIEGSKNSLNRKTCEILMNRGIQKVEEGKIILNRDQRIKLFDINELNPQQISAIASAIRCDVCLIRGLKSDFFEFGIQDCPEVLDVVRSSSNSFKLHSLDGGHHLHMDMPEKCLPLLLDFLKGKWWGNKEVQPILAIHGFFDNAATFDGLVPLLETDALLAIDIPGFGRSSNPPLGLSLHFHDLIIWLRYMIKHYFKWTSVTLIGHSFGSCLSFVYASAFSTEVIKYISIDCARFNMASKPEWILEDFRRCYKGGIIQGLNLLQEGSYEQFITSMIEKRKSVNLPLSEFACKILLERDIEKINGKFRSLVDTRPHLRYTDCPTLPFLQAMAQQILCPVLSIRASRGILQNHRLKHYEEHLSMMRSVVPVSVSGGHHVHLEDPQTVAPSINNFL